MAVNNVFINLVFTNIL